MASDLWQCANCDAVTPMPPASSIPDASPICPPCAGAGLCSCVEAL